MSGMGDRPSANTELQVVVTLKAAREVAETIEAMRRSLRQADLPAPRRAQIKDDLLEAAERLCNLLDLLSSWTGVVSAGVRRPLEDGIVELRTKLLSTGVRLVGDRAQKLIDQAQGIADQSQEFPIGVSVRLSEAVRTLMMTVQSLGGIGAMPPEIQDKLHAARAQITRVAALEDQVGLTRNIDMVP